MSSNKLSQRIFWCQVGAWSLGAIVTIVSIIAWGKDFAWHLTPLNAYIIFPVLGLTAYGLMWSHYVMGAIRSILKLNPAALRTYFRTTGWVVLILICLHPGLLIYQRFRDGFGLPPHSYESYVAPGFGWLTLLGTASLLVFLGYESWRIYGEKPWWHHVQEAGDLAMVAIFYHGLRLGTQTNHGWFHYVWWFYGITLITILVRSYTLKFIHFRSRQKKSPA